MHLLATWLTGLFAGIVSGLAQYFTRRLAVRVAFITMAVTTTVALFVALRALVFGVYASISNPYVLMGMSVLLPGNVEMCIGAMIASDVLVYLYRWHMMQLRAVMV